MHARIPSRVIAATLELALLAGSYPSTSASQMTMGDISALLELSPSPQEQQQIISEGRESSTLSSSSASASSSSDDDDGKDIEIISSPSKYASKSKSKSMFRSSFTFGPKTTSRHSSSSSVETTQCEYNATADPQTSGQSSGLFACISGFETDIWDGGNCGGAHFYKGHNSFWFPSEDGMRSGEGAKECYKECKGCLMNAVVDGASRVECRVRRGVMDVSRCWVGIE